ncbi:hypothetical protein TWF225_008402 [Orbilia oligospora]|nr:hypothetical protein TWF225_008402 [Orbilia oligospora]KAF3244483.1 hypothetical protein TWF217_010723 [Orbilia oligospora]KAF3268207.1 hypothetical protein TWF128_008210 [Orbilia oligospora]
MRGTGPAATQLLCFESTVPARIALQKPGPEIFQFLDVGHGTCSWKDCRDPELGQIGRVPSSIKLSKPSGNLRLKGGGPSPRSWASAPMFDKVEKENSLKRLFGKSRKGSNTPSSSPTVEKHQPSLAAFPQPPSNNYLNSFDRSSRGSVAMSDQSQRRDTIPSPTNIGRVTSTNMNSTESQRDVFVMPPPNPQPVKRPIGEKIVRWLKYGPVD